MTVTNSLQRQPTKLDYASPTQFKFSILKLPKVEYFCTSVNVAGIELSSGGTQGTMLKDIPLPGNKLTYEPLQMRFLVDENLENFQEIHGWLVGLGYPRDHTEFQNLLASGTDRFPSRTTSKSSEPGKAKFSAIDIGGTYSDATLTVLSSKNNAQVEIRFRDVDPTGLTGLQYDQQAADVHYLTATVSFQYLVYDFASVGSSTTRVTTT